MVRYGASTGKPSLAEMNVDGKAAYDYLANELNVSPENIVLVGESLGTGVACHLASCKVSNSLILISPFCSFIRLALFKLPWLNLYPLSWIPYPEIDSRQLLKSFEKPVLIIYGTDDMVIPTSESIELAKNCHHCTLAPIPGRGHIPYYPSTPDYVSSLSYFFKNAQ